MNSKKAVNIILSTLFIIFSILAIYFAIQPIQEPTGHYETKGACLVCPAFYKVEITKPNYTYSYASGAIAVTILASMGYLRRKLHRNN